jgi:hypothetical protein
MASDQIAILNSAPVARARTWPFHIGRQHVTALTTTFQGIGSGIRRFAMIPARPYASLWEASSVAGRARDGDAYAPDPFSTELPFLEDSWPNG